MTDESRGWGPDNTTPLAAASPQAGWYPDPWSQGHHRYWDGSTWTGGSFPHGPGSWADDGTDAAQAPPSPPPATTRDLQPPPPPEWSPPSTYSPWSPGPPADGWNTTPVPVEDPSKPSRLTSGVGFVALVAAVMIVVGSLGTLGGYLAFRHRSSPSPDPLASGPPSTVTPTQPAGPVDPSASVLDSLVVNQADVPSTVVVQPNPDSGQFSARAGTLDLCNGTFASEALRTARVQVTAFDGIATSLLSTEAVLYTNAAATQQAFSELQSVAAKCPSTPVVSPIGEPAAITQFNAPPDGAWAATPSVTRLAYDFVSTDELGSTQHSIAVYLRRGRVLMGIYFPQPDAPQISVNGQNTIEKIVGVFATRMANLPASVVKG
jgi:hypothetical protein